MPRALSQGVGAFGSTSLHLGRCAFRVDVCRSLELARASSGLRALSGRGALRHKPSLGSHLAGTL
eukprot:924445-Karenia_brevis.AAC.1